MSGREENIVLFPFMAQGHLIPFLALALQIRQRTGCIVTVVNTPLNIRNLRSLLPPSTSIRLVELPFRSQDHGLPPESENTDLLPPTHVIRLVYASFSLKPSFKRLISDITQQQGHPHVCIIADMLLGWTVEVANDLGILHFAFITGSAYGVAIFFSLWLELPHRRTESDEFSLPDFPEVSRVHRSQLSAALLNADGTDFLSICNQKNARLTLMSDGFLINTVEEMDKIGLEHLRRKTARKVWPIGPTFSYFINKPRISQADDAVRNCCVKWLDTHPINSVLYVSFGSQNSISHSQMMELAKGLEASGKIFIWVLRSPIGFNVNEEFRSKEWLPDGFEERMRESNQGLLIRRWAPQLEILSHNSTCAFLSHCGWNSVLESLSQGVPIIGWPLAAEQFFNSKLLEEEMEVCVEVARGNSCEVGHEQIASVIELVMGGTEKGENLRRKACAVKEMIEDAVNDDESYKGCSVKAMDEFFYFCRRKIE
ncbi:PREDICTED: UDP-glycosyltransferase 92A1-like [Nelumbo nucifera]|uniref:Glycosyltransferase n=1 Tax=Nelumbo nucifera TaxID=4432 RepID=A0A1U8ASL9_NELNU|nr:PREDICTED: UDP-glycosyltransferase 92A1-like [Nelumbo nucifera]